MVSSMTPLGKIADVFNGKTPAVSEQRDSGHPVLKIKDVLDNGTFCGSFDSFVDSDFLKKFESKKILEGDTLILNAAHNADYVGSKQFHATSAVAGALATGEWLIVRAHDVVANPSFVWHWLQAPEIRFKLKKLVKGIHLYPKDVQRIEIPLPSPAEQKRIAAILGKADAIRRKRQKAIQLADEFLRSVFLDMFGDPRINPRELDRESLGKLIKLRSGNFLPASQMNTAGSHLVYGGNGVSGRHDQYMFEEPQLVIGRVGVYCGAIHVTEPYSWVTDNALYVSEISAKLNRKYLEWALRIANLNQYANQAAQPLLSGGRIYPIEILVPSKDDQERFESISASFRATQSRLNELSKSGEELFGSVSQRAFRGEL